MIHLFCIYWLGPPSIPYILTCYDPNFLLDWVEVISPDVLNDYIIPGLRSVKQDILVLAPDYEVSAPFLSPPILCVAFTRHRLCSRLFTVITSISLTQETLTVLLQECEAKLEQKPFMGYVSYCLYVQYTLSGFDRNQNLSSPLGKPALQFYLPGAILN